MSILDSHLHVWDLDVSAYAWLGPQHGELHRTHTMSEAGPVLLAAGVDQAILVQAEDSLADTAYLLSVAARFERVAGVVGWVPLDDPDEAARELESLAAQPVAVGVRHLVHDDPRDDFLALPSVRASLARVAAAGLAFDVPDAWPRHLRGVADVADALPALTVVVDHLGKPPRGRSDFHDWAVALKRVASRPNTFAKVSGLHVDGQLLDAESLRPVWETALDTFGPGRLMYGGDWPITELSGGYAAHLAAIRPLVEELAPSEQDRLWSGTAHQAYRLAGGSHC